MNGLNLKTHIYINMNLNIFLKYAHLTEPVYGIHLGQIPPAKCELRHSSETSAEKSLTLHGHRNNTVRLERPVGLLMGFVSPKEAFTEAAFINLRKQSQITLARNYHLNMPVGRV